MDSEKGVKFWDKFLHRFPLIVLRNRTQCLMPLSEFPRKGAISFYYKCSPPIAETWRTSQGEHSHRELSTTEMAAFEPQLSLLKDPTASAGYRRHENYKPHCSYFQPVPLSIYFLVYSFLLHTTQAESWKHLSSGPQQCNSPTGTYLWSAFLKHIPPTSLKWYI